VRGLADWKPLVGKRVRVRLDQKTVVVGRLLALGDHGSAVVQDDDAEHWHVWPTLDVEEVEP
jgi:hypothetical protein